MFLRKEIQSQLYSQKAMSRNGHLANNNKENSIRYHHFSSYSFLCNAFDTGWNDQIQKKPWEINVRKRKKISSKIAYRHATDVTINQIIYRTNANNGTPLKLAPSLNEIIDYIGKNIETAKLYQLRKFFTNLQFLISLDNPTKQFLLTNKPDNICKCCIGDGQGIGNHCSVEISEDKSADHLAHMKFEKAPSNFVIKKEGNLYVLAQAFFNQDFFFYMSSNNRTI